MVKAAGYEAEILGASFKNSQQILEMGKFGIGSVTVNSDTLKTLAFNQVAAELEKPCWISRIFFGVVKTLPKN